MDKNLLISDEKKIKTGTVRYYLQKERQFCNPIMLPSEFRTYSEEIVMEEIKKEEALAVCTLAGNRTQIFGLGNQRSIR